MTNRPWEIQEQVVVEPSTKLRFEFTSEHSKAVEKGEEPPYHDKAIILNVYNESGTRVIRMDFTRGADFVSSTVEPLEKEEIPLSEQEKITAMMAPDRGEKEAVTAHDEWVTTQEDAWKGINLAQQFTSDIE